MSDRSIATTHDRPTHPQTDRHSYLPALSSHAIVPMLKLLRLYQ
ncbi:hypothetical protein [Kovacikia minuta]|nr:hypothetical protein [Kovacikia minuta]